MMSVGTWKSELYDGVAGVLERVTRYETKHGPEREYEIKDSNTFVERTH